MNYLLTGGAGFLGSNLTRRLLKKNGTTIHVVDNLSTGRKQNLEDLYSTEPWGTADGGLYFENENIKDYWYKDRAMFDRVINMACPASPVAYQRTPFQTMSASTEGVFNMLKAARAYNARFLHTSTSEVYGDPGVHPQDEEYFGNVNCYGPRACYDEGKRMGETIIWEFKRKNPFVDTRIVRIFNTYGPYMAKDDGRVVSNFICQALKNEPITIYGDGSQTRSFCYVDDLLDVLLMVLEGDYDKPLNIGNPGEFTMIELAETVKSVTGSKSALVFKDLPHDDPRQRCPDITKVKNLFGWEPKVQLKEGLEKTATYFASVI